QCAAAASAALLPSKAAACTDGERSGGWWWGEWGMRDDVLYTLFLPPHLSIPSIHRHPALPFSSLNLALMPPTYPQSPYLHPFHPHPPPFIPPPSLLCLSLRLFVSPLSTPPHSRPSPAPLSLSSPTRSIPPHIGSSSAHAAITTPVSPFPYHLPLLTAPLPLLFTSPSDPPTSHFISLPSPPHSPPPTQLPKPHPLSATVTTATMTSPRCWPS
ncbi:unnamed protein product, partial [Closterium sp. NIES-54]